MNQKILGLALAAVVLAASACSDSGEETPAGDDGAVASESGTYEAAFEFDPDPSVTGDNSLHALLKTAAGDPVPGATLAVEPWMPSMGHGSPTTPVVHDLDGGNYQIDALSFTMPGTWEVRIDVGCEHGEDRFVLTREVQ